MLAYRSATGALLHDETGKIEDGIGHPFHGTITQTNGRETTFAVSGFEASKHKCSVGFCLRY